MLINGTMQKHSFSIKFTISGEASDYKLTVSAPGLIPLERETKGSPYFLLDAMLDAAFKAACQRFPEQAPPFAAPKNKGRLPARSGARR